MTGIPRTVFEESERLIQHMQIDAAEKYIVPWLEKYPENHDLWHNIAIIKMFRGDWDQSEQAFRKVFAISPHFEDALYNCATMYHRAGKARDAMQILRRLIALNPNRSDAVLNAGDLCYSQTQFWDACQYYRRYMDIFPHKRTQMLSKIITCLQYAEQERTDDINVKFALWEALGELHDAA